MCILKGGSGSRWVDRLRVGVGYPVWGFRIEKKSPDFRSPEVGISVTQTSVLLIHDIMLNLIQ